MKIKVYVIDFEIPAHVRRWGLRIGLPFALLVLGGVAFAGLPGGYQDGQPLTAEALTANFNYLQNEIVGADGGAGLQGQIATLQGLVHPPSAFRAGLGSATPSIPSGQYTPVVFNTVVFDLANEFDNTTGLFTPNNAGTYLVTCAVWWGAHVAGAQYSAIISYGTQGMGDDGTDLQASDVNGSSVRPESIAIVQLSAGQSVTCNAFQNSGASQDLNGSTTYNAFSAVRIY